MVDFSAKIFKKIIFGFSKASFLSLSIYIVHFDNCLVKVFILFKHVLIVHINEIKCVYFITDCKFCVSLIPLRDKATILRKIYMIYIQYLCLVFR